MRISAAGKQCQNCQNYRLFNLGKTTLSSANQIKISRILLGIGHTLYKNEGRRVNSNYEYSPFISFYSNLFCFVRLKRLHPFMPCTIFPWIHSPSNKEHIRSQSIYKFDLSVCLGVFLFVCIQLTSKWLNRSGPNFLWDIT